MVEQVIVHWLTVVFLRIIRKVVCVEHVNVHRLAVVVLGISTKVVIVEHVIVHGLAMVVVLRVWLVVVGLVLWKKSPDLSLAGRLGCGVRRRTLKYTMIKQHDNFPYNLIV